MRKRSGLAIAVIALAMVAITASPVLATAPDVYFHVGGILDNNPPSAITPQQADSGPLKYAGGNPWVPVGAWSDSLFPGVSVSGYLHLWLGLKNSDDQGTNFDIMTVFNLGQLTLYDSCLTGITRNPALAKAYVSTGGGTGTLGSVQVYARIGTTDASNPSASKCAGHASATGLRLYYDSVNRPSGIYF